MTSAKHSDEAKAYDSDGSKFLNFGGASVHASRPAELLANLRVASPCPARWADMTGDDRARFCAQCQKHVYNLSEMTADAASNLIREKEGQLCVRFYQRADGTILTADCPVGVAAVLRRVKRLAVAVVALVFSSVVASVWAGNSGQRAERRARPKVYKAWDKAVTAVKDFVNPKPAPPVTPPRFTVGMLCPPPPSTNSRSNGANPPPVRRKAPPHPRAGRTLPA